MSSSLFNIPNPVLSPLKLEWLIKTFVFVLLKIITQGLTGGSISGIKYSSLQIFVLLFTKKLFVPSTKSYKLWHEHVYVHSPSPASAHPSTVPQELSSPKLELAAFSLISEGPRDPQTSFTSKL